MQTLDTILLAGFSILIIGGLYVFANTLVLDRQELTRDAVTAQDILMERARR